MKTLLLSCLVLFLSTTAHASKHTTTAIASFYGSESGSVCANGDRFIPSKLTAAHKTLPFGTKVKVTYNSKSIVVTINDRGPFIKGRSIDLSSGAAKRIGLTGVGRVMLEY